MSNPWYIDRRIPADAFAYSGPGVDFAGEVGAGVEIPLHGDGDAIGILPLVAAIPAIVALVPAVLDGLKPLIANAANKQAAHPHKPRKGHARKGHKRGTPGTIAIRDVAALVTALSKLTPAPMAGNQPVSTGEDQHMSVTMGADGRYYEMQGDAGIDVDVDFDFSPSALARAGIMGPLGPLAFMPGLTRGFMPGPRGPVRGRPLRPGGALPPRLAAAIAHHAGIPLHRAHMLRIIRRHDGRPAVGLDTGYGIDEIGDFGDDFGADDFGADDFGADGDDDFGAVPRWLRRFRPGRGRGGGPVIPETAFPVANRAGEPGVASLNPIPMLNGTAVNDRNAFTIPAGGTASPLSLLNEDQPYLSGQVVAFQTNVTTSAVNAQGYVEDFQITGGYPLFTHANAVNAAIYAKDLDKLPTLRDKPRLNSPSRTSVSAYAVGTNADVVVVACYTVIRVLFDDMAGRRHRASPT